MTHAAARITTEIDLAEQRERTATIFDRLGLIVAVASLLLGTVGVIYTSMLALNWWNQPFFGAFMSSSLVINTIRPLSTTEWPGLEAGIKAGDRVVSLSSERSVREVVTFEKVDDPVVLLNATLARVAPSERITVQVARPLNPAGSTPGCTASGTSEELCTFSYAVERLNLVDFIAQFGMGLLVAIGMLAIGAYVFTQRREQRAARVAAIICAGGAIMVMSRFELISTYQTTLISAFVICAVAGGFLHLGLTFPYPMVVIRRAPMMLGISYIYTLAGWALCATVAVIDQLDAQQLIAIGWALLAAAFMVLGLNHRRRNSSSAVVRDQATVVLFGLFLSCIPVVLWLLTTLVERLGQQMGVDLSPISFSSVFILPPMILFPLALAYSVLQYRTFNTDQILSEGALYTIMGFLLIIGYTLVTGVIFYLTAGIIRPNDPILIAGTLFLIAVGFSPLRMRLERMVNEAFFRQRQQYEKRIEQFARTITTSVELKDVAIRIQREFDDTVKPAYTFVFLRNLHTGEYEAAEDPITGKRQTDIHFDKDSPLIDLLRDQASLLYLDSKQALPPELIGERARMAVLNTPVIVRLQSSNRLNGFIALGPRQEVSAYAYEDLRFIESLAEQAASAFERAQMIIEARRNETELRVLAQVSAALNIVMDFDTLLEFVYAQVDKVISAPNFYIVLRDEQRDELYYSFYQEEGERQAEREGTHWRMGRDLVSEVIRTGQPLKAENYVLEMRRRDPQMPVENPSLRAWMGVPLNAGTGGFALGCLAIGTTDPALTYTEDQIRIFWNIADLAATAIYKTRLYKETEERARQMKVLNDISSQLASEFEDLDALLRVITESAMEILHAEAGSLLLRDEVANDLIFQYAIGGTGPDLIGSRIPLNSGIAGTVVQTGRHMIVNQAQTDQRWYGEVRGAQAAARKGFTTRQILAVPLTTRSGVLGVLEVINKREGTPFVEGDVNLLTAFAGQAAVAIENARLFKTTDQALAERVTQLDNMQRIDQELNRTLDFGRVVDLTIDNAMREANADGGLLCLVRRNPPEFEIVGCIGYPDDVLYPGMRMPINTGLLGRVFETGQAAQYPPMITSDDTSEKAALAAVFRPFLPGAVVQLAVPIITGRDVTAVLMLESTSPDPYSMVTTAFIQGLAEHANTAITNAQLYEQIKESNLARIQFVGFVAHEIKNAIAPIKGYAEILLGGVTGPLTDQQQNFMAVIRRNVVRMQQFVEDLRDLTAQEAGRLALKLSPVDFANIIIETVRPQQHAIDEKQQQVTLDYPETLPYVLGDETRLIQIMTNFVSNANKYTPPGGMITIRAESVQNYWDEQGAPYVIHCSISDTGIGMSEEDLQQLFKAYWRSDNPKAKEQPGTGLGMTLTRRLIEAHGGKIWVDSRLNEGTTFHMTIPLATQEDIIRAAPH